jgi:DNA-directed RNA polymerase alpha subunit
VILELDQQFEVLNPDLLIATLAKDVTLKLLSILKKVEVMFLLNKINQTMHL